MQGTSSCSRPRRRREGSSTLCFYGKSHGGIGKEAVHVYETAEKVQEFVCTSASAISPYRLPSLPKPSNRTRLSRRTVVMIVTSALFVTEYMEFLEEPHSRSIVYTQVALYLFSQFIDSHKCWHDLTTMTEKKHPSDAALCIHE